MLATVVTMVGTVAVDLAFSELVVLFGLGGGWGTAFVCYFVPSCIGLATSTGRSAWYRGALLLSATTVVVMATGFTYVTFT